MKYSECVRCGQLSPKWSFIGNAMASVFKVTVGFLTGSKGLVADGVHSAADAFSSLFIWMALKMAEKPGNVKYPFGFGKVEYISTLTAGIFLFFAATGIFIDALHTFRSGVHDAPDNAAIIATILSLFFSYLMYSSNMCAGSELHSPALIADANESKADSITLVAVLVGLVGSKMGFVWADVIAAVVVSLFIFHMSIEMFMQGVHGLVDISAEPDFVEEIRSESLKVAGVKGVRSIRTRRLGQKNWVDITIDVSRSNTILETHAITQKLRDTIIGKVEGVADLTVDTFPVGEWS